MKLTEDLILEFETSECFPLLTDRGIGHLLEPRLALLLGNANRLLREEMEKWPVVFGSTLRPVDGYNEKQYESTTHRSRIMPPQPIRKENTEEEAIRLLRYLTNYISMVGRTEAIGCAPIELVHAKQFLARIDQKG